MQVRDLSSPVTLPVQVEVIPACEFLMTLVVYTEPEDFKEGAAVPWREEVRRRASPELLQAAEAFGAPRFLWGKGLVGLALDSAPPRDAAALLRTVDKSNPEELMLHALGEGATRDPAAVELMHAAVAGDLQAKERLLEELGSGEKEARRDLERLFEMGAESLKERISFIVNGWYREVFAEEEGALRQVLERDAQDKRELQEQVPPDRLIEVATGGVVYAPEVGIERVVLVPSAVIRPWVIITEHRGTKVLLYPVAEAAMAGDEEAPPEHLVRMYKALGDESRLRILRLLAEGELQLTEIADQLGVAKSTAHHHLARLRVAGLVRVTTGAEKTYGLRQDVIGEMPEALTGYLGTPR